MSASVELHPLGFCVVDDFGPEGRIPVMGGNPHGVLIFHARHEADEYARLRDVCASEWTGEYSEAFLDAREACKDFSRTHGRVFTV